MRKIVKFALLSAAVAMGLSMVSCQKDDDNNSIHYEYANGNLTYKAVQLPLSVGENPITRDVEITHTELEDGIPSVEKYVFHDNGTIELMSNEDFTSEIVEGIENNPIGGFDDDEEFLSLMNARAIENDDSSEPELKASANLSYTWNEDKSEIYVKVDSIVLDGKSYTCDQVVKLVNDTFDGMFAEIDKEWAEMKKYLEMMGSSGSFPYANKRIAYDDFDIGFGDDDGDNSGSGYEEMMEALMSSDSFADVVAKIMGYNSYVELKNKTIDSIVSNFNAMRTFNVSLNNGEYTFTQKASDVKHYACEFSDENENSIEGSICEFAINGTDYFGFVNEDEIELKYVTETGFQKATATYAQSDDKETVTVTLGTETLTLTFDPFVLSENPVLD